MADTPKHAQDGCGLVGTILRRGVARPSRTSVTGGKDADVKLLTSSNSKAHRGSSGSSMLPAGKPPRKPSSDASAASSTTYHKKFGQRPRGLKDSSKSSTSFFTFTDSSMISGSQVVNSEYTKRLRREPTFKSGDLSVTSINGRSNATSSSGRFYRASDGSVMLLRELGNLNQREQGSIRGGRNARAAYGRENSVKIPAIGNILRKQTERNNSYGKGKNGLMNKMDPDSLKSIGNDKFKEGKFEDALELYNQAIALDPNKASFHSNKSAALMSLGHLMEAIVECSQAIRLDPFYHNAHYRMARLFIRLGEAEKAMDHYEKSGRKVSSQDISDAEKLQTKVSNCFRAQRHKNWDELLSECQKAVDLGADSAPQIYAMQAEALMELRRHEEAYKVIEEGPNVSIEHCTKFLGAAETAKLMIIRSRVYQTVGRFEDAVAGAREAAGIDTSGEVHSAAKRVDSVASSRMTGNRLFNSSRFGEACLVYTSALQEAPYNSVLLCNRAACRSKLGQHEKAVEDCAAALYVRPSYSKARLRRADSNAKLERWEAALKDYEILMQEVPGDEEVRKGYSEAAKQVQKQNKNENREPPRKSFGFKDATKNEILTTGAEFCSNNNGSIKALTGIDANNVANCVAIEFDHSVTTLQEIFTH